MTKRGRTPYPDVLTPRQWQVLDLIRDGLSKLNVNSREEAAISQRGQTHWWKLVHGLVIKPLRRLPFRGVAKVIAGSAVVMTGVALTLFALGLFTSQHRPAANSIVAGPLGKVAYVAGGHLWVKALPSGTPVLIASGATSPRWSPSGEWLLIAGGEYEVMRPDGSQIRRIDGKQAVWAPDADSIAYVSETDGSVVVENADGSDKRTLASKSLTPAGAPADWRGASFSYLAWKPDGKSLAFDVTESPFNPGEPTPFTCGAVAAAGSTPISRPTVNPEQLFTPADPPPPPPLCPGSPPPQRRASYYSGIWMADSGAGSPRLILDNNFFSNGQYRLAASPANPPPPDLIVHGWTLDGTSILYQTEAYFSGSYLAGGLEVFSVPVSGGPSRQLDFYALVYPEFFAVSPDESKLALGAGGNRYTWTNKRIATVDLTSGAMTYLTATNSAALAPAWSPDGSRIAYVSAPDIGDIPGGDEAKEGMAQRRIWVMDSDGSGKAQVTADPTYRDEQPQWSSDGKSIVFIRLNSEDQTSLWEVLPNGGRLTELIGNLSPPPASPGAPLWFGFYGHVDWSQVFDWWQAP